MFADAFVTSSIVRGVRDEKRREERGKSRRLMLWKVRVLALPTEGHVCTYALTTRGGVKQ
jgi:hypothetical protein